MSTTASIITAEPKWRPGKPMTLRQAAALKRQRTAAKVIGGSTGAIHSTDRFICDALRWLGYECGDVHLQMTKGDGWQVSTCFEDQAWKGWLCGDSIQDALAKAVIAVGRKRGDIVEASK